MALYRILDIMMFLVKCAKITTIIHDDVGNEIFIQDPTTIEMLATSKINDTGI